MNRKVSGDKMDDKKRFWLPNDSWDQIDYNVVSSKPHEWFAYLKRQEVAADLNEAMESRSALLQQGADSRSGVSQLLVALPKVYTVLDNLMLKQDEDAETLAKILGQLHTAKLFRQAGDKQGAIEILKILLIDAEALKDTTTSKYLQCLYLKWFPPYINSLPPGLIAQILKYTDMGTALSCLRLNRRWRGVTLKVMNAKSLELAKPSCPFGTSDYINTLPNEILLQVFAYQNSFTLYKSRLTCKKWNQIIASSPNLWNENMRLWGNLNEIDNQWKRLRMLSQGGRVKCLTLAYMPHDIKKMLQIEGEGKGVNGLEGSDNDEGDDRRYLGNERLKESWDDTTISKSFPFETLLDFTFQDLIHNVLSEVRIEFDTQQQDKFRKASDKLAEQVWTSLYRCTKLKSLGFENFGDFHTNVEGTPLASCRLEKFVVQSNKANLFKVSLSLENDQGIRAILTQAKHIEINRTMKSDTVYDILKASSTTLKSMKMTVKPIFQQHVAEERGMICMDKLRNFHGWFPRPPYTLKTPAMKHIFIPVQNANDLKVLWQCEESIEELIYRQIGYPTLSEECTWQVLFKSLNRTFPSESTTDTSSEKSESYHMIDEGITMCNNTRPCLAKLKKLMIIDHFARNPQCDITADSLVASLRKRIQAGHRPLEQLIFINCKAFSIDSLVQLRKLVGKVIFMCKKL